MATINVQNNYGQLTVIDGNVQLPGGRTMPLEEYNDLWQREEWAMQARREQLAESKAEKAELEHRDHAIDELISVVTMLTQSIEALRKEVTRNA